MAPIRFQWSKLATCSQTGPYMTLTFKKALNTAIVKYLVMKNYRNLLGDNFTHMSQKSEKALCRFQGY